jgi:TonB family protein
MSIIALLAAISANPSSPLPVPPPIIVVPTTPVPPPIVSTPIVSTATWPSEAPGRIVSSPNWSDYNNYPQAALRNDAEGLVVFRLLIDATGKPVQCAILASSGSVALDSGTCALANQMRFEPARDAEGKAVPSSYGTRVFWLLDDARPFQSSAMDAELSFEDGKLARCVATGSGPYLQPWKQLVCRDAQIYPQKFASRGGIPAKLILSVRVDAGDGSLAATSWPDGPTVARDYTSFTINSKGDATNCTADADGDIFSNDYRSQNPCGHFLSAIWFQQPDWKQKQVRGQYELRLIAQGK